MNTNLRGIQLGIQVGLWVAVAVLMLGAVNAPGQARRVERPQEGRPESPAQVSDSGPKDRSEGTWEDRGPADERQVRPRGPEMERRMNEIRERLARARAEGNEPEMDELERALDQLRRPMAGPGGRMDRGPGRPGMGNPPGMAAADPGMAERLEHLQIAIQHLRAAGMPEIAENLEREARAQQEWMMLRPRGSGQDRMQAEQIRRQMREMREQIRSLREQVERLSQEVRNRPAPAPER